MSFHTCQKLTEKAELPKYGIVLRVLLYVSGPACIEYWPSLYLGSKSSPNLMWLTLSCEQFLISR